MANGAPIYTGGTGVDGFPIVRLPTGQIASTGSVVYQRYLETGGTPVGSTPSQFLNVYNTAGTTSGFPTTPSSPGALAGLPAYGGSPAAGRIPQVPDPTATGAAAIGGNIANAPALQNLFNQSAETYVPGFGGLQAQELANIGANLRGEFNLPEFFRRRAEVGTASGAAGSDALATAEILFGRREAEAARALGGQQLSQAAARSRGILDLATMMQTPEQRQQWAYLASQLAAAPDPEAAFQRALALAREGINRGFNTGYGPGGGTTLSGSTSPAASIAQRYGGTQQPNPGTTPPGTTGPGTGYLRPSGFVPASVMEGMPEGGFESPGQVPYWYQGDPMDLVSDDYIRDYYDL